MASRFQRVAKRARIMMAWFPVCRDSGGGENLLHCLMKASALRLAAILRRARTVRSPEDRGKRHLAFRLRAALRLDALEGTFSGAPARKRTAAGLFQSQVTELPCRLC